MNTEQLRAKQGKIKSLLYAWCDDENSSYECLMQDLDKLGVVIADESAEWPSIMTLADDDFSRKQIIQAYKNAEKCDFHKTYPLVSKEG